MWCYVLCKLITYVLFAINAPSLWNLSLQMPRTHFILWLHDINAPKAEMDREAEDYGPLLRNNLQLMLMGYIKCDSQIWVCHHEIKIVCVQTS